MEKEICPHCGGDCKLRVNLDTGVTAKLDDRLMALSPLDAEVVCIECGLSRDAAIYDFDVSLNSGQLEFGDIQYYEND